MELGKIDELPRAGEPAEREGKTMAATNINRVVLTGNLTADPELRSLPSGTSVCKLRVACNTRPQGRSVRRVGRQAQLLQRHRVGRAGRERGGAICPRDAPVAIDGRLEWREWETQEGAKRRTSISCRLGAVPGLARGHLRWWLCGQRSSPGQRRPVDQGTSSPHLSPPGEATTTFRSRQAQGATSGKSARSRQASSPPR